MKIPLCYGKWNYAQQDVGGRSSPCNGIEEVKRKKCCSKEQGEVEGGTME